MATGDKIFWQACAAPAGESRSLQSTSFKTARLAKRWPKAGNHWQTPGNAGHSLEIASSGNLRLVAVCTQSSHHLRQIAHKTCIGCIGDMKHSLF